MSTQLATHNDLRSLLATEIIQKRFSDALGRNPGAFISTIITALNITPALNNCDPYSVITAALQAATLDLSISPALGQAAIIPYKDKAQFQIMRNGLIQLALRTNQYRDINTGEIYEGETITIDRFTGRAELGGARISEKIVGMFAYFQLRNGFEKYLIMSIEEIMEHAKKYSRSWDRANKKFYEGSAWDTAFYKMCAKTVLKLLLKNYGILSDRMQDALAHENETGEIEYHADTVTGEMTPTSPIQPSTSPIRVYTDNTAQAEVEPEEKRTIEQNLHDLGFE